MREKALAKEDGFRYYRFHTGERRIMAITPASQAGDGGSIPLARSKHTPLGIEGCVSLRSMGGSRGACYESFLITKARVYSAIVSSSVVSSGEGK